jgi:F-type H+-transporting ATPase subunit epsilon
MKLALRNLPMNESTQNSQDSMRLQVLLPTEVLVDEKTVKVIAEADNGSFCLLPRHIDLVSTLVPSILCFYDEANHEHFAAIDTGILVKCGQDVFVSTLNGVRGADLVSLQALIKDRFLNLQEHDRKVRAALARLEAGALRGFTEIREKPHG